MSDISRFLLFFSRKLLRYGAIILLVLSINFFIPHLMPGDPVTRLLGERAIGYDEKVIEELQERYGLNEPLLEQYLSYLKSISRLDLGFSIKRKVYVSELIEERFLWTLVLILPALVLGDLIALLLGSYCGFKEGRKVDAALSTFYTFLFACPSFLLTMIAIYFFCYRLKWFPLGSLSSGDVHGFYYFVDMIWHLVLPIAVLSAIGSTYVFMIVRSSVIQIKEEYFVFVARSKGLSEKAIRQRHVMPNVMPPFISIVALQLGFVVAGDLIIEILFSINGMGTMIFDAVLARDYPVMQGAFLVLTVFILFFNFVAEILYAVFDPRILDSKGDA
jgi:peptide/nickel transport system permease protein